ncbi:MAG: hypothetical protein V4605_08525 [Pseudomonadota bacterium]
MSFDYSKSAATALRLIEHFGRTIQHISIAEGVYDTETSTVINAETSTDVKACDFDFEDKSGGQMYQSDSLVQIGDRYALLAPSITAIDTSDKLVIDGVRWNIINVKKLAPAGSVVLWNCHIRK